MYIVNANLVVLLDLIVYGNYIIRKYSKRLKEILSQKKIQLLNSSESLNHRLWNFSDNYKHNWCSYENYNIYLKI